MARLLRFIETQPQESAIRALGDQFQNLTAELESLALRTVIYSMATSWLQAADWFWLITMVYVPALTGLHAEEKRPC